MANYNEGIIMALTTLNKQRDIVSMARGDHKQLVGKALENGDEIGYGFDSALAAIEDRRKVVPLPRMDWYKTDELSRL